MVAASSVKVPDHIDIVYTERRPATSQKLCNQLMCYILFIYLLKHSTTKTIMKTGDHFWTSELDS